MPLRSHPSIPMVMVWSRCSWLAYVQGPMACNATVFCVFCELVLLQAPRIKLPCMYGHILTSPLSFLKNILRPSDVAIPAASWPRCCRMVRPSYSSGDTCASWSASRMPITPHMLGPAALLVRRRRCRCLVWKLLLPLFPLLLLSNRRAQQLEVLPVQGLEKLSFAAIFELLLVV